MTAKLYFIRNTMLLSFVFLLWSCATDYDQIEQYSSTVNMEYVVKKLHYEDLQKAPKLKSIIDKLGRPTVDFEARQIYESPFGFAVDLDEFIYIGNDNIRIPLG